ncbi:MAG: hypothetical protein ACRD36_12465, partial [Candidatus Acidiferrum sp.]
CMAVPNKPGTSLRTLAVTTFGLVIAGTGLSVLSTILGFLMGFGPAAFGAFGATAGSGAGAIAAIGANLLGGLCGIAAFITFILFLRAVAVAVRRKELGKSLFTFLMVTVGGGAFVAIALIAAVAVTGLGVWSAGNAGPSAGPGAALAGGMIMFVGLFCLGLVFGLALFIWYIILLLRTRAAVDSYLRRI